MSLMDTAFYEMFTHSLPLEPLFFHSIPVSNKKAPLLKCVFQNAIQGVYISYFNCQLFKPVCCSLSLLS